MPISSIDARALACVCTACVVLVYGILGSKRRSSRCAVRVSVSVSIVALLRKYTNVVAVGRHAVIGEHTFRSFLLLSIKNLGLTVSDATFMFELESGCGV